MLSDVIATKLHPPLATNRLVPRPELLARFIGGLEFPLTLVCAPAGFGKTTLVAQWLAGQEVPGAWLSIDEQDSDPARFLTYFVHALQSVAPVGESVLQSLDAGSGSIGPAMTSLINELDTHERKLILVLDDYHELDSQEIDAALEMLVNRMPRSLRLVITSREDPPFALARMRARAQLTELRASDLRFTPEEAGTFLRESMGINLSDNDIRSLEQRTEGWIAGLQLAAVSLQGEADVAGFVASFSASNRFVLDYLLEEVIERQSTSVQEFLVRTSILDRFCAPLCDAVLGLEPGSSEETLRHLERANLFLISLDRDRRWFRYHHLFGELLRERAADTQSLHDSASRWFEEHDLPLEAFRHAAAAGDTTRALALVYSGNVPLYFRGHVRPVLRWIESLPEHEFVTTPELKAHHAWILWTAHRSDAATAVLATLPAAADLSDRTRGLAAALRAMIASNTYDTGTILGEAESALELLGDDDAYVRLSVLRMLAVAHQYRGEHSEARKIYQEVIRECRRSGNRFLEILTTSGLGILEESELRLTEAERLHRRVVDLVGEPTQPVACASWLGLARIAYQRNDLENAERWAKQAIELAESIEGIDVPVEGAVLLARIAYARGEHEEADAILAGAETQARENQFAVQLSAIEQLRTRRSADTGTDQTEETISEFLPILRAEDNVRFLADEGPTVIPLLEACVRLGVEPEFATRVLALLDAASPGGAIAAKREAAGLSRRELEVLRLLAGGLTNREIAERLFVSLSTVKGHTTRIYEKLGANRRTEAVARAREHGLL